jgi:bacterioferritin
MEVSNRFAEVGSAIVCSRPHTLPGGSLSMKGNDRILTVLNQLLADELTAISQYMVHSEMCGNWGYEKLHKAIEKQAIDEMHHAEWLIGRIIFLEGTPVVSKLNPIKIAPAVPGMIGNDEEAEAGAIQAYNAAIRLAHEVDDQGTVDLLTEILKMEEGHIDWNEAQRDQIAQMGLENYLSMQVDGAS